MSRPELHSYKRAVATMTTSMNEVTSSAIRKALASAAAGRIAEACKLGEEGLAQGGDIPAINAMLGMLHSRSGDFDQAGHHLRIAHAARRGDPIIAGNLANCLVQLNLNTEALEILNDEAVAADPGRGLLKLRGFLAQMDEQFELAVRSYEQAVAEDAGDWESWNNLGNARRGAGDFGGSVDALRRAVEISPASAPVRLNYATSLKSAGESDEAERQLRRMAEDFPDDAKPLRELHLLFKDQGRDEDALGAIEAAVRRDQDDVELWLALASHRLALLQHASAEEAYREVLARDPPNELANIGLALVFEVTNRSADLAGLADEAVARGASDDALNFIRAFDYRRAKRFQEGLAALRKVPEDLETARRAHLLGQLEEGAGHYDDAFRAFERMNEIQRADSSGPEERAEHYRESIRAQTAALTPEWFAKWRDTPTDDRASPVFLVGFPRSGTTLLDTILMGHPNVQVLEEEPALRDGIKSVADLSTLPVADGDQVRSARDAYFESAGSLVALNPGSLLVDKNPLGTNAIPFILRLFPDAKIILALRHPCDVVLSCFATNFKLNEGMSSFVRLDTTAELYDLTFRYFDRARELMNPRVHTVRYENIVEDRERELRSLFDFLGLEWHDDVLDHQATARDRGHIKTASYAQVVEPIYKRSAGRWQSFRKHLEPVFPVLRPWAEKFGYEI